MRGTDDDEALQVEEDFKQHECAHGHMDVTLQNYPDLKDYLDEVSDSIASTLDTRSIILFGGIALDDFSKKYSDIDIVVVLKTGLTEKEHQEIERLIAKLMEFDSVYTRLLYVYFIPIFMIESPSMEFNPGDSLIFGNGRMRPINQYPLSITDDYSIREKGRILFGEDLRRHFPKPPTDCFWEMFIRSLPYIEQAIQKHPFQFIEEHNDHTTVNWLLYFPRLLYSLMKDDLIGKSDSAPWFQEQYDGPLGDFLVEIARCRRKNTDLLNDKNLILNSRRVILFTLEKILEFRGVKSSLSDLVNIDSIETDFFPVMSKFRDSI